MTKAIICVVALLAVLVIGPAFSTGTNDSAIVKDGPRMGGCQSIGHGSDTGIALYRRGGIAMRVEGTGHTINVYETGGMLALQPVDSNMTAAAKAITGTK